MPRSTACRICGRDVAVRDGLGWAIVELREVVALAPQWGVHPAGVLRPYGLREAVATACERSELERA
jgi:hypothetical protein